MIYNNMTEEDIIKALECCSVENKQCAACPKFLEKMSCSTNLHKEALNLIFRYKNSTNALRGANAVLHAKNTKLMKLLNTMPRKRSWFKWLVAFVKQKCTLKSQDIQNH